MRSCCRSRQIQAGEGEEERDLPRRVQPPQNIVELLELAVADVHGAAAVAVIYADGKPERIADALLERDRVGVLHLAAARLLRLALRNTFVVSERLGLTHVESFFDDAFGGGSRIGHADQRARMACG